MKKIIAILVAVSMLVAFSAFTAFAAGEIQALDGSDDADVDVSVSKDGNTDTDIEIVYYVDVTWEDLTFTYVWSTENGTTVISWNPETHTYTDAEGNEATGEWTLDTITDAITVANHSNANIAPDANFSNNAKTSAAVNGVTASIAADEVILESAAAEGRYGVPANADSVAFDVSVDGQPSIVSQFTVDTITVTISNPDLAAAEEPISGDNP